jgi:hypothetical protein
LHRELRAGDAENAEYHQHSPDPAFGENSVATLDLYVMRVKAFHHLDDSIALKDERKKI